MSWLKLGLLQMTQPQFHELTPLHETGVLAYCFVFGPPAQTDCVAGVVGLELANVGSS
jgi:hypothetical protein